MSRLILERLRVTINKALERMPGVPDDLMTAISINPFCFDPARGSEYIPRGDRQAARPYAAGWKTKPITSSPRSTARTLAR
jgi:hypothetical protein